MSHFKTQGKISLTDTDDKVITVASDWFYHPRLFLKMNAGTLHLDTHC